MEDLTLNEALEELQKSSLNPELVKDNKFYFQYQNEWYRVNMPSQKELAEANQNRNKVKIQLLQKGKKEGFLMKKELIAVLKENGVDIEEMDKKIEKLKDNLIQMALTAAKKSDREEKQIEKLEEETKKIDDEIKKVINEKMTHLTPAIEYQSEDAWYKYLVSSCTEKAMDEERENWEKVWKTFSDFEKDNTNFPFVAEAHLCSMLQG
ncbi:MAG TPA: hypothetical protein VMX17_10165 [Candidatus Glassbacteria bacterium]|nr:hypothetical protein [Candidatus Glassbacteria bacterium]